MSTRTDALTDERAADVGARARSRDVVGPNAVIQLAAALRERGGEALAAEVFGAAGLARYLLAAPEHMVPEVEPARLFAMTLGVLGQERSADAVLARAGELTGAYILANRIPAAARGVLQALPRSLAGRVLLSAITRHAWTFAGSGAVVARFEHPLQLRIERNPLATPGCPWHVGVLSHLFRALAASDADVRHVTCAAEGDCACVSEIRLRR